MMRVAVSWLWWLSWIFLLLRPAGFYVSASVHPASGAPYGEESNIMAETTISLPRQLSTAILSSEPKTLTELGIPECDDSAKDCAYGGKCILGPGGRRSCLCPASCPGSIPVSCQAEKNDDYCMSMSDDYREKYSLPEPACHMGICVCPPMFDPWKMYESIKLLPFKCDRRQLKVQGVALPADSVYQGTDAMLLCCINMDPRTFVTYDGIDFIQNSSIIREPTNTPYDEKFTDGFAPPRCWSLDIKNAQFSDGGSYLCHVRTIGHHEIPANFTIEFAVKVIIDQFMDIDHYVFS
ncbi:hypothetical protein AB6A40_006117 [Gnathostoma spinigerum]|uniref:EGF-like domain-containing protein n=1 Tax=Gnathostoma spinigerum TaxID=75299 RepID=A0ABD6EQX0_9BILA